MSLCVKVRVRMKGGEGRRKVGRGLEMGMGVGVGVGVGVEFKLRVGMRMGQTVTATTTIRFSPVVLHLIFDLDTQRTFKLASGFSGGLFWRFCQFRLSQVCYSHPNFRKEGWRRKGEGRE